MMTEKTASDARNKANEGEGTMISNTQTGSADLYREATSRNIGLLSEAEQDVLQGATVAIAGMGAAGGHHLLALTRMGVGSFIIADPDCYEPVNMHRQAGAFVGTLGRNKAEVMAEMARQINPDVQIRVFPEAITERNVDAFLENANIYLDGIDFFQIDARRLLFAKSREKGIWAITAGPVGYGSSVQTFDPKGMSFDKFFGIKEGMTRAERLACFAIGLLPRLPKGSSMNRSRVDFEREKGPALISAIMICSGVMVTEAMRILLKREGIRAVPHSYYFDPFGRRFDHGYSPFGRNSLRDRLLRWVAFRIYPSLKRLHESELETAALNSVA